jgi:hypothetical protein
MLHALLGGSGEWTSNLPSMLALVENWSPPLISSAVVSFERILGTFYGILDSCASLEEKVLLGIFKGLIAVAKFIAEDSKRQSQASHSGALDPHSSQLDGGLSPS